MSKLIIMSYEGDEMRKKIDWGSIVMYSVCSAIGLAIIAGVIWWVKG